MKPSRFYLLVRETPDQKWRNSGEGPWKTEGGSKEFADAECGVDWRIAQGCGVRDALTNPLYIEFGLSRCQFEFRGTIQECPLHVYELGQRIANRLQELIGVPRRYHDMLPEVLDELVATRKGLR